MNRGVPLSGQARSAGAFDRLAARLGWLFLAAILLALAAQFLLAFRIFVNWDEFHFLSFVYEHWRGEPVGRFQTMHVHLFSWLPGLGTTEIDEIAAARLVMAALGCFSAVLIYAIARRFLAREAALFGLLLYLSVDAVTQHMASFRTDPLATFLCLLSLFLLLHQPRAMTARAGTAGATTVGAMLAGVVMAVAAMVTVKVAFYLVAIGAAMLCLAPAWPARIRLALSFGVPFLLTFAGLFWWHGTTLTPRIVDAGIVAAGGGAFDIAAGFLRAAASKMFLEDGLLPRWRSLLVNLALNPLFWILTIWGAWLALRDALKGDRRNARQGDGYGALSSEAPRGDTHPRDTEPPRLENAWLVLALAIPVAVPLFYRNAFDYNFVFILPPAAILAGLAFERVRIRAMASGRLSAHLLFAAISLAPCIFLLAGILRHLPDAIGPQRQTIDAVHRVFPEPVPYIDGFGVLPRFLRVGFFHSGWGIGSYRDAGRPVYPDLVAAMQAPLLLADSPALHAALLEEGRTPDEIALLPEDAAFLATHYRQYWGMIFVAGQSLTVAKPGGLGAFEIVLAGDYRLEAAGPVRIDGFPLESGSIVRLEAGAHEFRAGPGMTEAALIWAAAQPPPETEPVGLLEFFDVGP